MRNSPPSITAETRPPTCSSARPAGCARARISATRSPAWGTNVEAASSARRITISRCRAGAKTPSRSTAMRSAPASSASTSASSRSVSSRNSSAVRRTLAAAAGWTASRAGSKTVAHARARVGGAVVAFVFAPGEPSLPAVGGGLAYASAPAAAAPTCPRARHAEQSTTSGRGGETVEDRLDLVGGGVAGRHQSCLALGRPRARGTPSSNTHSPPAPRLLPRSATSKAAR